jgi:hypothetical protein
MKKAVLVLMVLAVGAYLVYAFMNSPAKAAYMAYQAFATPRVKDDIVTANLTLNNNFRVEGTEYTLESHESDGGGIKLVVFQKVGIILSNSPAMVQHRMRHYVTMRREGSDWTVAELEIELLDNRGKRLPGTDIRKVL